MTMIYMQSVCRYKQKYIILLSFEINYVYHGWNTYTH